MVAVAAAMQVAYGCAASVKGPPTLRPNASDADRLSLYGRYRLQPLGDETVVRGTEMLNVAQLRQLTASCPVAHDRVSSGSVMPWLAGGAGLGLFGAGLARQELSDQGGDDGLNITLMAAGAGLAALALFLEMTDQPSRQDLEAATMAYNACLRAEIAKSAPKAQAFEPLSRPLGPPGPRRPSQTIRIEGTASANTSTVAR